jgi:transaldolase
MNQLDALKQYTTVVADTGDFKQLGALPASRRHHQPLADPQGGAKARLRAAAQRRSQRPTGAGRSTKSMDQLLVRFGCEILAIIPGRSPPKSMPG